jgi:hypothetical protein
VEKGAALVRKLFSADPARIGRFECAPTADAVPLHVAHGTPKGRRADLITLLDKDKALHRAGAAEALKQIAGGLADEVEVPVATTGCGTAGERRLLHSELVVSATREIRSALDARRADAYLSVKRTCETGLRRATGRPNESFVFQLDELSRPTAGPHKASTYAAGADSRAGNRRFELDGADPIPSLSGSRQN